MKSLLDDIEHIKQFDPNGMLKYITNFPQSARKALQNTEKITYNIHGINYESILVAGMGGSAVGG